MTAKFAVNLNHPRLNDHVENLDIGERELDYLIALKLLTVRDVVEKADELKEMFTLHRAGRAYNYIIRAVFDYYVNGLSEEEEEKFTQKIKIEA